MHHDTTCTMKVVFMYILHVFFFLIRFLVTMRIRGLWPCLLDLNSCDVYLYMLKDTDMVVILAQRSIQSTVSSVSPAQL